MNASFQSARSASPSDRTSFPAVQMPIEGPVSDVEEAVQKLKQCSPAELKRARQHHRRALKALRTGGYKALSGETRQQLVKRLQTELEALNIALAEVGRRESPTNRGAECQDGSRALSGEVSSSPLRDVLPWNW